MLDGQRTLFYLDLNPYSSLEGLGSLSMRNGEIQCRIF